MPKRKAPFAFASGSPAKLAKRSTNASITAFKTRSSVRRPAFTPVVLSPSPTRTTEIAPTSPFADSDPVPSLRRDSTLELKAESTTGSGSSSSLSRHSSKSQTRTKTTSLRKRDTSIFAEGSLVTRLSGTKSGSVVGVTTVTGADTDNERRPLSKKMSSVKAGPSGIKMPSGLTNLALPSSAFAESIMKFNDSVLIKDVGEDEVSSALASLKSTLSKRKPGTSSSVPTNSISNSISKASMTKFRSKPSLSRDASKPGLSKLDSVGSLLKSQSKTSVTKLSSKQPCLSRDFSKAGLSKSTSRASNMSKAASVRSDRTEPNGNNEEPDDVSIDENIAGPSAADPSAAYDLPHSDLVEVALSFDTTGSMHGYLEEVRAKMQDLIQRLQADIPGIRIAVIAHGDYFDAASNYVLKWIDFTTSVADLCDFVKDVAPTHGGDTEECYELVLKRTRSDLSWTPGSKRLLIMITDNCPHEPGYMFKGVTYNIDWREECAALKDMGVRVYGVFAGVTFGGRLFSEQISRLTGGVPLSISNFGALFDMIMMICYKESNPDMLQAYVEEIAARTAKERWDFSDVTKKFGVVIVSNEHPGAAGPQTAVKKVSKAKPKKALKADATGGNKKRTKALRPGNVEHVKEKAKGKAKQRATAKTVKTSSKKTNKKCKTERQFREKINEGKFCTGPLKKLVWSKWMTCVIRKTTSSTNKKGFRPTASRRGMRTTSMFDDDFSQPSLYEVGVRSSHNSKVYPLYYKATQGFTSKSMYNFLFSAVFIKKEVDMAVWQDLIVSVRRGQPKVKTTAAKKRAVDESRKYVEKNIDYAWKPYPWRRLWHRSVKIFRKGQNSISISHGDFREFTSSNISGYISTSRK